MYYTIPMTFKRAYCMYLRGFALLCVLMVLALAMMTHVPAGWEILSTVTR